MFNSCLRQLNRQPLLVAIRHCSAEVGSNAYLENLVSKSPVVVFMKGTPDNPRCGFSNAVVQIMRMHGVQYDSYNVLDDEKIRQGIKEFSKWPTIPQVYLNKEFIGGCDILLQMHQSGELIEELRKNGIISSLLEEELEKDKSKPAEK
ncbi:Glutaredoxin-like 5 [Hyalella azteca]|uniref:Glutaredoxin-related protein 5, mitochondrial n=1 Tax=Hyalella azteca TaxID=294128 RepID=A0A6A0H3Z7_HYAAZ|nr:glutaredoxin-related protein 5, mitochondrial-like [Hyalella azteca]KAA0199006.1 Glutaredoxin-like 5 [Hyalella azteca]